MNSITELVVALSFVVVPVLLMVVCIIRDEIRKAKMNKQYIKEIQWY